ncbi:MAG: DUF72 domain-containing protein [Crenarchaeota archaeon]|nr:DUF72 domain-containing protein [Thermoproteota archaeon]
MQIKVGTCGIRQPRKRYYESLDVVELQETFYDMPNPERLKELRKEAPREFEFTIKVFQALTHSPRSPTWRRMKYKLRGNIENYGLLRPTKENLELWEEFLNNTKPVEARVYIFQTPPSLPATEESCRWIVEFFNTIRRDDLIIGWEPRGGFYERVDLLEKVLESCNIIHVVDPFRRFPLRRREINYFRLHGIGPGETNYRYKYSDEDLKKLLSICRECNGSLIYVLFNNVYMLDDATRFRKLAKSMV